MFVWHTDVSAVSPTFLEAERHSTLSCQNSSVHDRILEGQTPPFQSVLPEWLRWRATDFVFVGTNPFAIIVMIFMWLKKTNTAHRRLNETFSHHHHCRFIIVDQTRLSIFCRTKTCNVSQTWTRWTMPSPPLTPPAPCPLFAHQDPLTLIKILKQA